MGFLFLLILIVIVIAVAASSGSGKSRYAGSYHVGYALDYDEGAYEDYWDILLFCSGYRCRI